MKANDLNNCIVNQSILKYQLKLLLLLIGKSKIRKRLSTIYQIEDSSKTLRQNKTSNHSVNQDKNDKERS